MMTLPPGFDISALVGEFVDLSLPFVSAAVLIAVTVVILKVLRRG